MTASTVHPTPTAAARRRTRVVQWVAGHRPFLGAWAGILVAAWVLGGIVSALGALAIAAWIAAGHPDRRRVAALAALAVGLTAVAWLLHGTPQADQVGILATPRPAVDVPAMLALTWMVLAAILPGRWLPAGDPTRAIPDVPVTDWPEVHRARAVAIVVVVLIHALPFLPPTVQYLDWWFADITRFAVPTLLLLSGYLVPDRRLGRPWLERRAQRVLGPYLVASVVVLVASQVLPLVEPRPVLRSLLLADALGPFYYVFVLAVLIAFTPLLRRLGVRALALATLLGAAVSFWADLQPLSELSLFARQHLPVLWAGYYLAGMLLRRHRQRLVDLADRLVVPSLWVATIAAVFVGVAPFGSGPRRAVTSILVWVLMALLMATATSRRAVPLGRTTRLLSVRSYPLYLYHVPVVAGLAGTFGASVLTLRPWVTWITSILFVLWLLHLVHVIAPRRAGGILGG